MTFSKNIFPRKTFSKMKIPKIVVAPNSLKRIGNIVIEDTKTLGSNFTPFKIGMELTKAATKTL